MYDRQCARLADIYRSARGNAEEGYSVVLETALMELAPLIGGENNISFQDVGTDRLYFRLKDQSLVDVSALRNLDWVRDCSVKNGQLTITLSNEKEEKSMASNKKIAEEVLRAVGGKENIANLTHCITRLRFNLRDESIPDQAAMEQIDGVIKVVKAPGQFQVVIGNNVAKVYDELCAMAGLEKREAIQENLDKKQREPGVKGFCKWLFGGIADGVSGCVVPLIPLIMVAGLLRMVPTLFGDTMGILSRESDLYTLLTFCGDSGLYFLPIAVGYTGAKKFGATPVLGILLGAMLIHPTFLGIVNAASEAAMANAAPVTFTVFGIPCTLGTYTQTIIPMILATWVMGYVERFFKKYIPDFLSTVVTPLLTIVVMIPLTFCLLAPVGSWLANVVYAILNGIHTVAGPVGYALVCGLWLLLLTCGLHQVLIAMAIVPLLMNNPDSFIMSASGLSAFATYGVIIGGFLRAKKAETRVELGGYFLSNFLGGVGEPVLFGFILKYKKPLIAQIVGGFVGGLVAGFAHVTVYTAMPVLNFMNFLGYMDPNGSSNIIWAGISAAVCVVVAAVVTYVLGFDEEGVERPAVGAAAR